MVTVKRTRGGTQPLALTRDDVIDAGVAIVAIGGVDALSVSAVARTLGVSSPAVYHYVGSKDDLVKRVCERVALEVEMPTETTGSWVDRIVAIIVKMNETFARYPGVAAEVLPIRHQSKAVDRISMSVRSCILEGGISGPDVDDLLATLHFLVGGWLLGQRPNMREGQMTPELLERAVRWTLLGVISQAVDQESGPRAASS